MATLNPTDANGYIGVPAATDTFSPAFPKWMYNPTLPAVIVANWSQELALLNQNTGWSESSVNAVLPPIPPVTKLSSFSNDTQAALGGVPIGGQYLNGNFLMQRIS